MSNLLSFEFLAILNLFVMLLWPATGYYTSSRPANAGTTPRTNVLGIIMMILTVIAVILDIIFIVLHLVR